MEHSIFSNEDLKNIWSKDTAKVPVRKIKKQSSKKKNVHPKESIHLKALHREMQWLQTIIEKRFYDLLTENNSESPSVLEIAPLLKIDLASSYGSLLKKHKLQELERVILALAIASSHYPVLLKPFIRIEEQNSSLTIDIGGQYDKAKRIFNPTFQTALFLLAGNDISLWSHYNVQINDDNPLLQHDIIYNQDIHGAIQGKIELDSAYLEYFCTGTIPRLDHGDYFPGHLYESNLSMNDIILEDTVKNGITSIDAYVEALKNGFFDTNDHHFNPGFIALFYGPPGTGKTMLAGILANTYDMPMYHVDLSRVVSKYIGETEKNLERIFKRLQGKNCVLFFDEADALFGKRSDVKDAHDRYANQEVSYLLQRIEKFDGLTILASNYENNMDDAFKRRMDIAVNVIRPKEIQREALWKQYLPKNLAFENEDLLKNLVNNYAYTGANIRNIMKSVAIALHNKKEAIITHEVITPYLLIENDKAFGKNQARVQPRNIRASRDT